MGFILLYDITNEESFAAVQDWWVEGDEKGTFALWDMARTICHVDFINPEGHSNNVMNVI